MHAEITPMNDMKCWSLELLPHNTKAVVSKWVYCVKCKANVKVAIKCKAQICAKGFSQIPGIDFHDVVAPTMKSTTLKLIFSEVLLQH